MWYLCIVFFQKMCFSRAIYVTIVPGVLILVCWSCHFEQYFVSQQAYYIPWGDYNEPFLVLHKIIVVNQPFLAKICVLFSSLWTLSQSIGIPSTSACCAVFGKSFKRLLSHLAHNLACKSYYMLRANAVATEAFVLYILWPIEPCLETSKHGGSCCGP